MKHPLLLLALLALAAGALRGEDDKLPRDAGKAPAVEFNRDVRPILSDNCFRCHGPDKGNRRAKLRLDVREIAVERGAIAPGKPDESKLVERIFSTKTAKMMPPPESHKKLTPAQKETLQRWIAEGAEYQPHWAYIPPKRPAVPAVKGRDWVQNPIDAFVLQALEAKGIAPSPEADRRTLLRRLSLDLTGLPPTPEEVQAFVEDKGPKACEKAVDRLLASPHYGERMAVPWLDLARYADTVGYHGDQNQNVFPYRDYVIAAFNKNKPFDQFTVEQLAGDLLPNPTVEQRVATGFNRLNMMTREGGAQPKEYLAKYSADRVRTVAAAWLGSTLGCAECHDHKFDPFTTKDFYQLAAFFADVKQWGVYSDYKYTPNPDLKGFTNDHPFPPELRVESDYLKRREQRLRGQIAGLLDAAAAKLDKDERQRAAFEEWRREGLAFLKASPAGWATPKPEVTLVPKAKTAPKPESAVEPDGRVVLTGDPAAEAQLKLPLPPGWLAAVKLELLPHAKHGGSITRGAAKDMTVQLAAALKKAGGKETALAFRHADADPKEPRYQNGAELLGVRRGWKTSAKHAKEPHASVWLLDQPVRVGDGDTLVVKLTGAAGCVRVSVSPFAADRPLLTDWRKDLPAALEAEAPAVLARQAYLLGTGRDAEALARYQELAREVLECRGGKADTLVTEAMKPLTTRVLPRGNWQDESGEVVEPAPPHFLPAPRADGRRLTRLDLAKWLVAPDNPLTARVFVNRLWKQFFGAGLSAVVDDLGSQGEWPTHLELLDWLAVEFRASGWDVKHLVKLMVTSATYRQDSNPRPQLRDVDPNNRLLAAQNPRRLEAEFVRDNALAVAGLLNRDVGGPSARPYQPAGYYRDLQFPDRDYLPQLDDRQYRRGVYVHWQRTFLHPMLANFDAPSREECTAARVVANTPQQALTLLNDPTFVEAARVFAQGLLRSGADADEKRLELAYQKVLARPPKDKEKESLLKFLAGQRVHYRENSEEAKKLLRAGLAPAPKDVDAAELAAWAGVCRVLLNLNETITRY